MNREMTPTDLLTLAVVADLLSGASLVAAVIAARRAATVDPLEAL